MDIAQLKKLAELAKHPSTYWHENSKLTKIDTILALLARLEKAEDAIDEANQRFTFYGVSAEEDLATGIDNVFCKGKTASEAALRTLREAAQAVVNEYSPMVCCDWCSARFDADNYGIVSGVHEPDCEFLTLAAALAGAPEGEK